MSERSNTHVIQIDPWWQRALAYRCPICAAMLLSEEDFGKHAEWHRSVVMFSGPVHLVSPEGEVVMIPRNYQAENEKLDAQFNEVAKRAEDYFSGMRRRATWWIGI